MRYEDPSKAGLKRRCVWEFELKDESVIPEVRGEKWQGDIELELEALMGPDSEAAIFLKEMTGEATMIRFTCTRPLKGITENDPMPDPGKYEEMCDDVWEDMYEQALGALSKVFNIDAIEAFPDSSQSMDFRHYLYWIEVLRGSGSWFVVGTDATTGYVSVQTFYDDLMGFKPAEGGPSSWPKNIWPIPEEFVDEHPDWFKEIPFVANRQVIEACEGKFLNGSKFPRSVQMPISTNGHGDPSQQVFTETSSPQQPFGIGRLN